MESLTSLTAISPIDGRYRDKTQNLMPYFSEYGLIRYRVLIEVEYFIALCELPLPQLKYVHHYFSLEELRELYFDFDEAQAKQIKDCEKTTNHDVKAVEYYLKDKLEARGLGAYREFIHFGLTSQDVNNTAIPYAFRDAIHNEYFPLLEQVVSKLSELADLWSNVPMLSRTHGQPASPTRLGKELDVFVERLNKQEQLLSKIPSNAKFGGATGNFNAHHLAYPGIDWIKFANDFVNNRLKLERSQTTTQIDHYDNFGAIFDNLKRINTILLDLCRDMWAYISMDYFKQQIRKDEVGSSAMPHKVNPIDFENAEGNLGVANALFEHLASKLPVSRLQRDLTDSTVIRNTGVPFAHTMIAMRSILKGLNKLVINRSAIDADLEKNWLVVAEAIQTVLRREGYPKPYEALKAITRTHQHINQEAIHRFIDTLDVKEAVKQELKEITPFNYTGVKLKRSSKGK